MTMNGAFLAACLITLLRLENFCERDQNNFSRGEMRLDTLRIADRAQAKNEDEL